MTGAERPGHERAALSRHDLPVFCHERAVCAATSGTTLRCPTDRQRWSLGAFSRVAVPLVPATGVSASYEYHSVWVIRYAANGSNGGAAAAATHATLEWIGTLPERRSQGRRQWRIRDV